MTIPAIQGTYHDGKIEALEEIPFKEDKRVIIVFLDDDRTWDDAVATDFLRGYSKEDTAYDRL